jgi:hypothetical protein
VAFLVVSFSKVPTRRNIVTITRSGSTKKYADNWALAFGTVKSTKKAAKKSPKAVAKKAKKKGVKRKSKA